jgi:hypothetical protein
VGAEKTARYVKVEKDGKTSVEHVWFATSPTQLEYAKKMAGIDVRDHYLASSHIHLSSKRWYMPLFHLVVALRTEDATIGNVASAQRGCALWSGVRCAWIDVTTKEFDQRADRRALQGTVRTLATRARRQLAALARAHRDEWGAADRFGARASRQLTPRSRSERPYGSLQGAPVGSLPRFSAFFAISVRRRARRAADRPAQRAAG